ncbi:S-adenosyl-L-methionine-dependent methyltransferase [Apiospora marii]|uniref:S-adenosyl-L-methionine-dependent methyltransferase n=1 Tax=Apiospora marii TaxID=335849 RepID=UPI0031307DD9
MAEKQESNYTQGYSEATVASHASRTVDSDAAFLKPYIKPTDRILDVGCGPGTITVGFHALVDGAAGGGVTGVDISDEILAQARETAAANMDTAATPDNNNTAIEFLKADVLKGLPFPDDAFTVVYASQLFPHLATPALRYRALAEMRRVLRPGGVLATRDAAELHFYPRHYDLDRLWAGRMVRALRQGGGESDVDRDGENEAACFPGGDMPALFQSVGFGGSSLVVGAGTTVHSGPEMRRWFAGTLRDRLRPGDAFRESWANAGITDREVEETCGALGRWAEDEGGWYVAVQAEILGWKSG